MPNLLPLLVTLGVFALMRKKKLSSLKVMLILIVIAFVGGVIGIF